MKTESIQAILNAQFGSKEDYTLEETSQITSLSISRFNVAGDIVPVYAPDLLAFPNLESLVISQCLIDSDFIQCICNLKKLKQITFIHCEIIGDYHDLFQLQLLKDFTFDGTEVNFSLLNHGMFDTLVFSNIEISEKVEFYVNTLDVKKAIVYNWDFIQNKIDTLIVSSKQFESTHLLQEYKGHLLIMDDHYPEVMEEVNA